MPNIEIQNNKTRGVVVWEPVFKDETVTAAAADVFAAGTILARDTTTLNLVLFVKGGTTNGNGVPKAILTQELEFTGAGNLPARPMVEGQVRTGDLVIDADGDASNIDAAVLDQLRDYGIVGRTTLQLAELDNQ